MENPYRILGVAENATDEQIKEVYRELSKKYHPDLQNELPKEEAERKMAEINAAYDEIMRLRRGSGSSSFSDIRSLINQKRIAEAERLLDSMSTDKRNAEWHFLKGSVLYSKGFFNDAYTHFDSAVRLDPSSREYAAAFNNINQRRNGTYTPGGYHTTTRGGGCCGGDLCTNLICADCCCECMGGDLIPCC